MNSYEFFEFLSSYDFSASLEVHRLIDLTIRLGNKLEKILDDNKESFTLAGIAHACFFFCSLLAAFSMRYRVVLCFFFASVKFL